MTTRWPFAMTPLGLMWAAWIRAGRSPLWVATAAWRDWQHATVFYEPGNANEWERRRALEADGLYQTGD